VLRIADQVDLHDAIAGDGELDGADDASTGRPRQTGDTVDEREPHRAEDRTSGGERRVATFPGEQWPYIRLHIYMLSRMLVRMPAEVAVLEVIAEPTRRRILDAVRGGERSVGELVEKVGMHQPGVSRHLRVLRDAGLVEVRRDAQRRLYRLRPEPLMELDAWLEPYRAEWTARLDSLERHLRRTATPIPPSAKEHR
jgi:DNA-binding transcriptional ArsR family regulator